jgi:hypothetical protein
VFAAEFAKIEAEVAALVAEVTPEVVLSATKVKAVLLTIKNESAVEIAKAELVIEKLEADAKAFAAKVEAEAKAEVSKL